MGKGKAGERRGGEAVLPEGLKRIIHSVYMYLYTANSLEKTLMLGKIEGKRRKGW